MNLKLEIKKRADIFNVELDSFLKSRKPQELYDAARHLPLAGGKRLRPVISMVACESLESDYNNVIPFGLSIELIHNFSLVHDDIMDKSKKRRNIDTVHIKYGEPTAILAGDLLFAKVFDSVETYSANSRFFRQLNKLLIKGTLDVCEGQQLDINFEKRAIIKEDEYFEMISKKTAALFQISSEGGIIAADGSEDQQKALRTYGKSLGLAFQIRDDVLDMSSTIETLGKDIGNDIRNGKKTLIAVHCLNNTEGRDKELLDSIFGNQSATDEQVNQIYNLFQRIGSVDYAAKKAVYFSNLAKESLSVLPDSNAKDILDELAEYAMTREK
jgi:geranylgeranyl diphosphate synthase type I